MSTDRSRLGSAREEAERLMAAGLAVASTALQGVEGNRQIRGLAEQMFGADRVQDLAAGLAGFVSGAGSSSTSAPAGDAPPADSAASSAPDAPPAGSPVADAPPAGSPVADAPPAGSSAPGSSAPGSSAPGSSAPDSSAPDSPPPGLSTGSAACCVCPVCRLIGALRDPSPEFAERLATAAGDLAVGISGFLRALSGAAPGPGHAAGDDPWRAATTATPPTEAPEGPPAAADEPAPAATPAAKKTTAKKTVAKKTTAKKTTAKRAVAKQATAEQTVAKKTTAKKTTAKKAVRKAVRSDPPDGQA